MVSFFNAIELSKLLYFFQFSEIEKIGLGYASVVMHGFGVIQGFMFFLGCLYVDDLISPPGIFPNFCMKIGTVTPLPHT